MPLQRRSVRRRANYQWRVAQHGFRLILSVSIGIFLYVGDLSVVQAAPALASSAEASGASSDQSYYLAMRDGTRLAMSIYFPGHVMPAQAAPVLLLQTRYGRAHSASQGDAWRRAGYVVVAVDVRGTTSSFGYRDSEIGPDEQQDMEDIVAHLAHQPWSNGKVIAAGISYLADTADMATTRHASALVAAIPRETDFDFYDLFWPGGIPNKYLFLGWGGEVFQMDFGRQAANSDASQSALDCGLRVQDCPKLFPLLQPVDDDRDYRLLREALNTREAQRKHWSTEDYGNAVFRDDKGLNGYAIFEGSAGDHLAAVRRERKPVQYWGSWVDANTADAALNRYRSTPDVPSIIIITANNHHGDIGADPFFPAQRDPFPSLGEQDQLNLAFSGQIMEGRRPPRVIKYYVLGAHAMRETSVWPPVGIKQVKLSLDVNGRLSDSTPSAGVDIHQVDFTASTGTGNRWTTQNGPPPVYTDRRKEDSKLLTYDSEALKEDSELAGWAVVTLRMRAKTSDPAVFAYIEDVAPDGRVTYVTEGQLRVVNRKIADPATLPYDQGPAPHSFNRADALAARPGKAFTVRFKLYSTAALIKRGHRIRLAIAGADTDTFKRLSNGETEQFEIFRGGAEPSEVILPLRPWH